MRAFTASTFLTIALLGADVGTAQAQGYGSTSNLTAAERTRLDYLEDRRAAGGLSIREMAAIDREIRDLWGLQLTRSGNPEMRAPKPTPKPAPAATPTPPPSAERTSPSEMRDRPRREPAESLRPEPREKPHIGGIGRM